MSAPETPVEVVALALDRYAELDEFQPLEDYVLKALSEAGYAVVHRGEALWSQATRATDAGPNKSYIVPPLFDCPPGTEVVVVRTGGEQ